MEWFYPVFRKTTFTGQYLDWSIPHISLHHVMRFEPITAAHFDQRCNNVIYHLNQSASYVRLAHPNQSFPSSAQLTGSTPVPHVLWASGGFFFISFKLKICLYSSVPDGSLFTSHQLYISVISILTQNVCMYFLCRIQRQSGRKISVPMKRLSSLRHLLSARWALCILVECILSLVLFSS